MKKGEVDCAKEISKRGLVQGNSNFSFQGLKIHLLLLEKNNHGLD